MVTIPARMTGSLCLFLRQRKLHCLCVVKHHKCFGEKIADLNEANFSIKSLTFILGKGVMTHWLSKLM